MYWSLENLKYNYFFKTEKDVKFNRPYYMTSIHDIKNQL